MPQNIPFAWLPATMALIFSPLLCISGLSIVARGEEPSIQWLTGQTLLEQLDQNVSITWSARPGVPLRQALMHLGQAQQVAILLDRRVDPDQKIELTSTEATLDATLKLIAARLSIGVGQVGSVMYFGPEATARRVRTLAALRNEDARRLPSTVRSRFTRVRAWKWDDLATPRDLLATLASECKVEIQGIDQIPHDLWARADLPPMNFCDRLTLIAAQFDLTFSIDPRGESVTLAPIPQAVEISHAYPLRVVVEGGGDAIVATLSKLLPEAHIRYSAGELFVRGRAEDQDFVGMTLSGKKPKQKIASKLEQRYTLSVVSVEVGRLIKTLGKRLDLDVQFDNAAIEAAGLSLTTEVKVDVKLVTSDELLRAALEPAGLTFERKGTRIVVRPK